MTKHSIVLFIFWKKWCELWINVQACKGFHDNCTTKKILQLLIQYPLITVNFNLNVHKILLPFQKHCCGWLQNSIRSSFEVLWELFSYALESRYRIEDLFFLPVVVTACNQRGCSYKSNSSATSIEKQITYYRT